MKSKVSIVVPCYNKEQYIGAMLQSVIAQTWDNIELIFVNDGSTDGTRAVIEGFIPKILTRGYEYNLIDQENQGQAAAVKKGLCQVSGEYCCSIDSDDEILPEYVSTMASFLEEHPEYDWTFCDIGICENQYKPDLVPFDFYFPERPMGKMMTENFILMRFNIHVGHYLVRTNYLLKHRVIEQYDTTKGASQEPQFIIPLAEGGGKLKYFPQVLYKNNQYAAEHSTNNTPEEARRYTEVFGKVYHKTVDTLDITPSRREYLHSLCDIFELKMLVNILIPMKDAPALEDAATRLCELSRRQLSDCPGVTPERLLQAGLPTFIHALEYVALGLENPFLDNPPTGRIIGYGALGLIAQRLLPALAGTPLQPELLWDRGGPGMSVIGSAVTKPDIDALNPGDVVMIFPRRLDIVSEMAPRFEEKGCRVFKYFDILDALAAVYFGDMLKTARFLPGNGDQEGH